MLSCEYYDFVVKRDSTSNARLRARELCGHGEYMDANLKLRRGVTKEVECFPAPTSNYENSMHQIAVEKLRDICTM